MSRLDVMKVKTIFKERGLTQASVADKLDLDRSTLSAWFSGRAIPTDENLNKLAEELEVDPSDITSDGDISGVNVQSPGNTIYVNSYQEVETITITINTLNLVLPSADINVKELISSLIKSHNLNTDGNNNERT